MAGVRVPRCNQIAEVLQEVDMQASNVVDTLDAGKRGVGRAIRGGVFEYVKSWEGPFSSPGSTTSSPRSQWIGYLVPEATLLQVRLAIRMIRAATDRWDALVGQAALVNDPDVLIADITDPEAMTVARAIADDCMLILSLIPI